MKTTLLSLLIASASFATYANTAGDNLPYFSGEREAVQSGALVLDMSGQSDQQLAKALSEMERLSPNPIVIEAAERAINNNRKLAPEYTKMMEAQAKLKGVSVATLFAAAVNTDWVVNESIKKGTADTISGCTTVAFNNGIVGQTNDLSLSALTDHTTLVKTDDSLFVVADGAHFQGMGRHVGIVLNFLGEPSGKSGIDADNLVTHDAIFAAAVQQERVEDVINMLKPYSTIVALNFTVVDDKGASAAIEISADGMNVIRGERGVAHANHNQDFRQQMSQLETEYEMNAAFFDTFAREDAANLFLDYSQELSVEGMQYLFNQRPINLTKYNDKDFVTVEAMVFDVKNGCAYVSGDNPRFSEYTKVCLD
ncbi:carcinine hydrolase/isopenicillin-N N-acyltransferase family protein [Vibrio sp. E150_011]